MCKYIKSNKEKCKIKSKGDYCHIHKKYQIDEFKQNEIKNLNKVINNKRIQYEKILQLKQDYINQLLIESEIKESYIKSQRFEIEDLKSQLETARWANHELNNQNQELKDDATKYQIIKEYEKYKNDLILKGVNIYNYNNNEFQNRRHYRNRIAHPI